MVKDELNSEEKFFEKAVITEKFVKKYKKPLIGVVALIVVIVAANIGYQVSEQNRVQSANATLALLEKNPNNSVALAKLESLSPALHDVWSYSQAVANKNIAELEKLKDSKTLIINDVAGYEAAENKKSIQELEAYSQKQNAIYRDLAIVMSAIVFMQEGKVDQAHTKLGLITANSPFAQVASALMHYGVK